MRALHHLESSVECPWALLALEGNKQEEGEEAQLLTTQQTNTPTAHTHTQQTEHGDKQNDTTKVVSKTNGLETSLSMQRFLVVSSGGMAAVSSTL